MSNWIRDPLRGFSFDKYPYERVGNEKSIDFSVKMFLYCSLYLTAVIFELPGMIALGFLYFLSLKRK